MNTAVIVKLQVEGLHQWAVCDIREVAYLSSLHRHVFHVECKKEVSHDDRDIEIISFKHELKKYLLGVYSTDGLVCNFGGRSCEMIAKELLQKFELNYCSVLEDGENGAEVTK